MWLRVGINLGDVMIDGEDLVERATTLRPGWSRKGTRGRLCFAEAECTHRRNLSRQGLFKQDRGVDRTTICAVTDLVAATCTVRDDDCP